MKKFVLFSLTLVLVLSMMPLPAFAEEIDEEEVIIYNTELLDEDPSFVQPFADDPEPENPDSSPEPPVSSRQLTISEIVIRGCLNDAPTCSDNKEASFVEIYNNSSDEFNLSGWRLQYVVSNSTTGAKGGTTTIANLPDLISGFEYVVIARDGSFPGLATVTMAISGIGNQSQGYLQIVDETGEVIDIVGYGARSVEAKGGAPIAAPSLNRSAQRCELPGGLLIDSGANSGDFAVYDEKTPGFGVACLAPEPPASPNDCAGLIISEIGANLDKQFIEIYNPTNQAINLSGCQIQTNRNKSVFTFGEENLATDAYRAIWIADTPLTLTKTTTGTVYILSSDGQNEVNSVSYAGLAKETSWSLINEDSVGEWRQTYALTPDAANVWLAYPPCEEGYERNLETGRCRKIPVENILAPCPEGQFRNPETNRCKKIDSGSTLVPCKEGQERNPETNRCRNIPTENELKPCAEGYERNPETNRCRKVNQTTPAAFAIDNDMGGGAGGLWQWGAAGALVTMFSVVAWQYRTEIGRRFGSIKPYLSRKAASAETT